MNLDQLPDGKPCRVKSVQEFPEFPEIAYQLEEIGFIPGEPVRVLRRNALGGDPLLVRIGLSTFALRRKEAELIEVEELSSNERV